MPSQWRIQCRFFRVAERLYTWCGAPGPPDGLAISLEEYGGLICENMLVGAHRPDAAFLKCSGDHLWGQRLLGSGDSSWEPHTAEGLDKPQGACSLTVFTGEFRIISCFLTLFFVVFTLITGDKNPGTVFLEGLGSSQGPGIKRGDLP